jgi:hypothetical protein
MLMLKSGEVGMLVGVAVTVDVGMAVGVMQDMVTRAVSTTFVKLPKLRPPITIRRLPIAVPPAS